MSGTTVITEISDAGIQGIGTIGTIVVNSPFSEQKDIVSIIETQKDEERLVRMTDEKFPT